MWYRQILLCRHAYMNADEDVVYRQRCVVRYMPVWKSGHRHANTVHRTKFTMIKTAIRMQSRCLEPPYACNHDSFAGEDVFSCMYTRHTCAYTLTYVHTHTHTSTQSATFCTNLLAWIFFPMSFLNKFVWVWVRAEKYGWIIRGRRSSGIYLQAHCSTC